MTGGFGADYTFEATGNVAVMRQAVEAARMGWGLCTVAGVAGKGETLDIVPRFLITGRRVAGSSFGGVKGRDEVPAARRPLPGRRDRRRPVHLAPDHARRGQPRLRADGGPGRHPQRDRVRLSVEARRLARSRSAADRVEQSDWLSNAYLVVRRAGRQGGAGRLEHGHRSARRARRARGDRDHPPAAHPPPLRPRGRRRGAGRALRRRRSSPTSSPTS